MRKEIAYWAISFFFVHGSLIVFEARSADPYYAMSLGVAWMINHPRNKEK